VANINEQREVAQHIMSLIVKGTPHADAQIAEAGMCLAELVIALDHWRRTGGFDPYSA
jgi:hypothetical protein